MKWYQVVVVGLALAQVARADTHVPYRANLRGVGSTSTEQFLARKLTTRLHTEGRVLLRFTRQKPATWKATTVRGGVERGDPQSVTLLQGEAIVRGIAYPAAASLVDGRFQVVFPGRERGSRGSRQRIYTLTGSPSDQGEPSVRVSAAPAAIFGGKSCAHADDVNTTAANSRIVRPLAASSKNDRTYRVITIGTVADAELYQRHGAGTNAFVASIINTAEALYDRQLGIRFEIARQVAYGEASSSALSESDPGALLSAFAHRSESPAILGPGSEAFDSDIDVKHLFSGKDLDGTTVGIAYIGVVCYQPQSAYGLTQATSSAAAPYYFAHEIGHNLGARHDLQAWWGMSVMSPTVSIGSTFSDLSIAQINEHLAAFGSCLEQKTMPPNLSNAVLTLMSVRDRAGVRFRGRLLSSAHGPIEGVKIRLLIGARTVRVTTNSEGAYSYLSRQRGVSDRVKVLATTEGGEVRSRTLVVRSSR